MDQRFRIAFPAMYEDWEKHARVGTIRPGDQLRTLLPNGAAVHTLAIKRGMNDPVDLDAVTGSLAKALATTAAPSITFHRIGTRCQGRLPWSAIASAIGPIAASSGTDVIILTDEWDNLVDALSVGDRMSGMVMRSLTFGAFLDIGWPFPAFVDVACLSPDNPLQEGQSLEVEIVLLDDARQQVRAWPADPDLRRAELLTTP